MAQVSRYPLQKEIEVRIHELLDDGLAALGSRDDIERFLADLLTPTEKIMLAKRLAIALLLEKGYDYRQISRVLKVSTSTVRSVVNWKRVRGKGYEKVVKILVTQEKWEKVLRQVAEFFADFKREMRGYI